MSKETFSRIDAIIWHLCFRWAKRRHPNKSKGWVLEQYFKPIKGRSYRFSGFEKQEDGTLQQQTLLIMAYTPIRRHVKILQSAHPYDRKYDEYFEVRTSGKWRNNSKRHSIESYINMIQQGKCPCCTEALKVNQNWCISLKRKASTGGEYKLVRPAKVKLDCFMR